MQFRGLTRWATLGLGARRTASARPQRARRPDRHRRLDRLAERPLGAAPRAGATDAGPASPATSTAPPPTAARAGRRQPGSPHASRPRARRWCSSAHRRRGQHSAWAPARSASTVRIDRTTPTAPTVGGGSPPGSPLASVTITGARPRPTAARAWPATSTAPRPTAAPPGRRDRRRARPSGHRRGRDRRPVPQRRRRRQRLRLGAATPPARRTPPASTAPAPSRRPSPAARWPGRSLPRHRHGLRLDGRHGRLHRVRVPHLHRRRRDLVGRRTGSSTVTRRGPDAGAAAHRGRAGQRVGLGRHPGRPTPCASTAPRPAPRPSPAATDMAARHLRHLSATGGSNDGLSGVDHYEYRTSTDGGTSWGGGHGRHGRRHRRGHHVAVPHG